MVELFVFSLLFLSKLEARLEDRALFYAAVNITELVPSGGNLPKLSTDKCLLRFSYYRHCQLTVPLCLQWTAVTNMPGQYS